MAAAVLTLLSLIYLGGLAALLCVAYSRHHFSRYTAVKAAVSCGFLVIAATAYLLGGHTADAYFRGLLPCFVLCLAGDVLLGLANNHAGFFRPLVPAGSGRFHTGPRRVLRAVHAGHAGRTALHTVGRRRSAGRVGRDGCLRAAQTLQAAAHAHGAARSGVLALRRADVRPRHRRSALPAADGAARWLPWGPRCSSFRTRCCCSFIFMSGRAKRCVR